jgi:ATP-dependent DNA helicase RecQ
MTKNTSISDALVILKNTFGFDGFRTNQEQVISALLEGTDVLAVMPTGSGKSLCFQVPTLMHGGLTIVVSPLVALMEDQVAALKLAGVSAEAINSSRSYADNVDSWKRVAAGQSPFLYLAPERLMTARMLNALQRLPVKMIAIDEAHCISRWGPSFRPDYEDLGRLRELFPDAPIAALTATADQATREDIAAQLFHGNGQIFVSGFDRPNIRLAVEMRMQWKQQLLDFVKTHEGESGIIYCLSRKKTEECAEFLNKNNIRTLPYHAGMAATQRGVNQDIFMTEPGVVMAATIAFGMGIDKPDVRYVFHTNLPATMEAYYQEIGRAGRDGAPAEAFMLYGMDDIAARRRFIEQEDTSSDHQRREHKRLDTLISFCETPECRRQSLLSYFGDETKPCGNCDICHNPPDLIDGTVMAQQLLQVAEDTGQRFGAIHLIDVIRGMDTEKIRSFNHHRLSGYGVAKDTKKPQWQSIVRQLVAADFLKIDVAGYGGISLSPKGWDLLRGKCQFRYRQDIMKRKSKPSKAAKTARARSVEDLSQRDNDLLNALKQQRLSIARERNVPAFVIFPDKTLIDMAAKQPGNKEEFAQVHGVGKSKLEKFSESFLQVIANFDG